MTPELTAAYRQLEAGQLAGAQQAFQDLISQFPELDPAWNGLGICYERQQQIPQAQQAYTRALALNAQEPEYLNNLAACQLALGQISEAVDSLEQLSRLKPDAESYYNLAILLTHAEHMEDALHYLHKAVLMKPNWEFPQRQLFVILQTMSYEPSCLTFLRQHLQERPDDAFWHFALGIYHDERREIDVALRYYRSALQLNPALFEAYRSLISLHQGQSQYRQALDLATRLHEIENSPRSAMEILTSLQNPLPASRAEIEQMRERIESLLDYFLSHPETFESVKFGNYARPNIVNFYHAYHGENDRPLQEKLARFHKASLPPLHFELKANAKPRIGLVSLHFYDHSVMHLLLSCMEALLQADDFEVFVYFIHHPPASRIDDLTRRLEKQAAHFRYLPEHHLEAAQLIAGDNLDILIYPDLGMDTLTYTLALYRLARYQLTMPGHPITSGSPEIDFFLSGEHLEIPEGQQFYTEKLICLPGIPDYQAPRVPPLIERERLGLPAGNVYFCPMTTFKIHPDFDQVMRLIFEQDPEAKIAFLEFKNGLHTQLYARFQQTLPDFLERVHFFPWAPRRHFFQVLQAVDVILDTFYFGGGNTSYQALGLDRPLVALEMPWNKGRWTQAMYRLMGIEGLVGKDLEAYAQIAVRLATDKAWQAELREQIAARKQVLFNNPTWTQAVLDFCRHLVAKTA